MKCLYCGQECQPIAVKDYGHGETEFWGAVQNESQLVEVSDCCNEPVEDYYEF